MARCLSVLIRYTPKFINPIKRALFGKYLIIICSFVFISYLVWSQLDIVSQPPQIDLVQEALLNGARDARFAEIYRKSSRLSKDLKYILLWTSSAYAPLYFLGRGQRAFITNNCSVINCYVTTDRTLLGDVSKFSAVAFNGRNLYGLTKTQLPKVRSPNQKYIYFDMESADNYPVCNEQYDGFFNWTSTYRLDSDIPYPYIQIRDKDNRVIGPKSNMNWTKMTLDVDNDLIWSLKNKTKAGAWFVSNCSVRSKRKEFVTKLQKALSPYGLTVDVFGACGNMKCTRDHQSDCDAMLKREYFFYMSLENSLAQDYVTEKLLTALHNDAVPVVLGGADYSRFLPPESFLDARKQSVSKLAAAMARSVLSSKLYRQYFKWRNYYTYQDPASTSNVCDLCAALNNKTMTETHTVYHNFREWWYPNFRKRCNVIKPSG